MCVWADNFLENEQKFEFAIEMQEGVVSSMMTCMNNKVRDAAQTLMEKSNTTYAKCTE